MIELEIGCQLLRLIDDRGAELVRGDGVVQMDAAGKLTIVIHVGNQTMSSITLLRDVDKCHLEGRTAAGWNVRADQVQVERMSFDSATGVAETSVAVIGECALVPYPTPTNWTRRVLTFINASVHGLPSGFQLEEIDWSVEEDANLPAGGNRPAPCQVAVSLTARSGPWDAPAERTRLTRLLSLYTRTPVTLVREDIYDGSECVSIGLSHASRNDDADRGVGPRKTTSVADFLKQTMVGYSLHADHYNLPLVVDYAWRIHAEQTLEIKLVLASVLLESFKFHWASNLGPHETPPIQAALTNRGTVRSFYERLNRHGDPVPLHFADLLSRAATAAGTPNFDAAVIAERNCIFHTGITSWGQLGVGATYPFLLQLVRDLLDSIDVLLLRLLGYRGAVLRWWDRTQFDV